jgi:hypothetical protein
VQELERAEGLRRNAWATDYPGGVHVGTITGETTNARMVQLARKLGYAVVATAPNAHESKLELYALPLAANAQ